MAIETKQTETVEYLSAGSFVTTLERIVTAIEAAGMRIFARIDHAAGAREVGLAMPPTMLLLYGHPKGGTPIMLATPQAALELPLRVLVREDDEGRTFISFHSIAAQLLNAGVGQELAFRLEPAQHILLEAAKP
jgi:uncharacterized protein (DUF302 family)